MKLRSFTAALFAALALACGSHRGGRSSGESKEPDDGGARAELDARANDDSIDAGSNHDDPNGGPRIISVNTNITILTEESQLVVTAIVTDPDGVDDVIGGTLLDAESGATYGVFATSAAEGAYEIRLGWSDLHAVTPINFDAALPGSRSLVASFFDVAGHNSTREVLITLSCNAPTESACDGTCVDLQEDPQNCGGCDLACDNDGVCFSGTCGNGLSSSTRRSCDDLCAEYSDMGCIDAAYTYDDSSTLMGCSMTPPSTHGGSYFSHATCICSGPSTVTCTGGSESTVARCSDGCSNDGDSYVDCEDFNCCGVVACGPETACGAEE